MAEQLTLHEQYKNISFRPMMKIGGEFRRVGIQNSSPICFDPEIYGNLMTAAPALYQMLSAVKDILSQTGAVQTVEAIEMVLVFAQLGYAGLSDTNVNELIKGLQK